LFEIGDVDVAAPADQVQLPAVEAAELKLAECL